VDQPLVGAIVQVFEVGLHHAGEGFRPHRVVMVRTRTRPCWSSSF
jgi:hypothetical protein